MDIPTNKVIFTGQLRTGKNHVATCLNLQTIPVADPFYMTCTALLGSCDKTNPTHRRFLQFLGNWGKGEMTEADMPWIPSREEVTFIFRKHPEQVLDAEHLSLPINWDGFGRTPYFWIDVARQKTKRILAKNPDARVSIPNGRFPEDIVAFQQLGFLHLHVICSEETRRTRMDGKLPPEAENDRTEDYAKHLDATMVGPCVIWNDEGKPVPRDKGYLTLEELLAQQHLFAVIRADPLCPGSRIEDQIAVKEIVHTPEGAQSEVDRLNKLNGDKGCQYFWHQTRFGKHKNA